MTGWLAAALAVAAVQPLPQDSVRVETRLSAARVVTGATVVLEVRVETPGVRPVRINLPPLPPSLNIVGTQDFTQDQIRMPGGRTRIVQRNVVLSPDRPGTFLIPTIPVDVDGTTYRTAPLQLEVMPGGQPGPSGLPDVEPDDIRLMARLDRNTVYVGEQAVLEVEALFPRDMRQRQTRPATFETPNPPGFWVSEVPGGLTGGVRLYQGDYYETQRYRRVYVPLEPGIYALDPVRLRYEVRRGHLYGAEQREQVSDSLRLRVMPLPERGRPASFTGAVGRYRTAAWLQPATLAVGDAATLSIEVTGTGNVKTLPPPRLPELEGVEVFPPSEEAEVTVRGDRLGGTKRFTWVLVPERSGPIDLGAIEYAFFDPETGAYGVARADPLRLDVDDAGRAVDAGSADTALARVRMNPAADRWAFVRSPLYMAAQAIPLLALLVLVWVRRTSTAPAAVLREQRARHLAALDALADEDADDRAFLGRLASTVRAALAERAHRPTLRSAPADALRVELEDAGASAYAATAAAALVRRLDQARFAGAAPPVERAALIAEARAVLERVENELAPPPGPSAGTAGLVILALLLPGPLVAQEAEEAGFRDGIGAYLRADYAAAIGIFQARVGAVPVDAAAWYNLGNAFHGVGDRGRAVWAWRQALELEPRNGATRRNLRIAGGGGALAGAPPRFSLTIEETGLLLGLCWWLAAGALAVHLLRRNRAALRIAAGAGVCGCLVLVSGLSALRAPSAVALDGRTPLLAGPAARSDTVAVVPAGTPVRIVGREGEWLRVRTWDRAEGWGLPGGFAEVAPGD